MFDSWPPNDIPQGRSDAGHQPERQSAPLAPPRDLIALALLAGSAVLYFLIAPALLLVWISARWRVIEKLLATAIPLALMLAARQVDSSSEAKQTLGMLAIASCIAAAFFLAARLAGREKRR